MIKLLALLTLLALPASAQVAVSPEEEASDKSMIARTYPVVERERDGSFLRIAFQLSGPFPATDVSPPYGLSLSMYVLFPEWGTSEASWFIAGVLEAQPPTRVRAGIYEIVVRTINDQQSMGMDCFIADKTLEIDAREASIAARASRPEEFFGFGTIEEDIFVSVKASKCSADQSWATY